MTNKTFKNTMMTAAVALTAFGLAACGGENGDSAENYPEREVELIIPWSPGGGSDIEGRLVAEYTAENFDSSFVVINSPGVGGTVGLEELSEKEPDGYSLGQIHEGLLVAHHTDITSINYDTFIPIAAMSSSDQILAVPSDFEADTLEEFIAYGQENEIRFGGTVAGIPRVWVEQLGKELGINYNLVGYEGLSEAIQALAGGHIDAAIVDYSSANEFVEAGHMKFLAIGTSERVENLPDVPTFLEEGHDITMSINRGYVAPEGTDPAIIEKLAEAFEATAQNQEYIDAVGNVGSSVNFMGPDEYGAYLDEQNELISEIVSEISE